MAVHPNSGSVIGFQELLNSENAPNESELLSATTKARPLIDCIMRDDARQLEQFLAETRSPVDNTMALKARIKYFLMDRFHAINHKCGLGNRPDAPLNRRGLSSPNATRAESVFTQFRNYRHRDTMRRRRNTGKKAHLNK